MKVCMVATDFPVQRDGGSVTYGGAGACMAQLVGGLIKEGVEVAVVTRKERGSYSELFGVPVYRTGFLDVGVRSLKMSHSLTVVPTLSRVLKGGGFDVVHSHNPPAAIPASWCAGRQGLPHVTTMHGPWADVRLHAVSRFLCRMVERKALRYADHVTCDSKRLAGDVLGQYGIDAAKVSAIQNAVETDRFSPDAVSKREARVRLGLSAGGRIVLYTGRFLVEKGITYLLEAIEGIVKESGDVSFLLVGGGFDEHVVSDWLSKTHLQRRVTIIPYVEYERMPSVYLAADALVQPSLAEGLSRSILEAMACGLPIVATDVGGNPELVSGNGVLVKPRSAAAIKEALTGLLSDDPVRTAMGRESRRRAVSEFSVERRIQSFIEVYDRVCGG